MLLINTVKRYDKDPSIELKRFMGIQRMVQREGHR